MDLRCLGLVFLCLTASCGPGELPGFANPPPDDSGVRKPDASGEDRGEDDDEDAGTIDSGHREVDVSDAAAR